MNTSKLKELIKEREQIDAQNDVLTEQNHNEQFELLSDNLLETMDFLNICSSEEIYWVSELFEKLKSGFSEKYKAEFEPEVLVYKEKKQEPITPEQVRFLKAIIEYHHLELAPDYESMTKSEASRLVDTLLVKHGRIPYVR